MLREGALREKKEKKKAVSCAHHQMGKLVPFLMKFYYVIPGVELNILV